MSSYTLKNDGDETEKRCWSKFIKDDFPSYESFWQNFIVNLTNRPIDIHFKTNTILSGDGKGDKEVCLAQLHYTILKHLERTYDITQLPHLDFDKFMEGIARLSSAMDVADELLERYTSSTYYNPWSETSGSAARKSWRSRDNSMQYIRNYRNRMIHGRMVPGIAILGTYLRFRFPKIGKENYYIDWRNLTDNSIGSGGEVRSDFDAPEKILKLAWEDVICYLEKQWRSHLI